MKKAKDKVLKAQKDADGTQINAGKKQGDNKKIQRNSALSQRESASGTLEWQSPEFEYREKDVSWYWLGLIISICLLALAVWQKNFLFAIFVVIAYLVVVYSANQKPAVWKFTINEEGIEIDPMKGKSAASRFYKYEEIGGFDVWDKELVLKTNKKISPYLKINFPAEKEKEIKEFLVKHIPEEEYEIPVADSFSKLIGF